MSWHFLRESEAASWEAASLDGAPSALSNLMPTVGACYSPASETGASTDSPSGTTFGPSMAGRGVEQLMLFPVDSRVRTSRPPAGVPASPALNNHSGVSSNASTARSDHDMRLSRTQARSELTDSTLFSRTLPAWGMMRNGAWWARTPLARRISAGVAGSSRPMPMLMTPLAKNHETGPAYEVKNPAATAFWNALRALQPPGTTTKNGGPWIAFREWMMGWPIGWTALEPLETDRWLEWLRWHGGR